MSLSVEYNNIRANISRIEAQIPKGIQKKTKLIEAGKAYAMVDSELRGYSEDLKKYQSKLKLLFKETPPNNITLINEFNQLSIKSETLILCIKNNKIPTKGISYKDTDEDIDSKATGYSLENRKVSEEFSIMIKKLKQISKEIDNNITKEQNIIEQQSNQMDSMNTDINSTKYKLDQLMNKSSNLCLIITILVEVLILLWVLL